MSDKDGFGPKKPKATFGDVMLGIPAGRGGEAGERKREERPRREGGRRPQGERGPGARAEGGQPKPQGERPRRDRKERPERKEHKERAASPGPMVVVRRATGAVETRELAAKPEAEASAPVEQVAEQPAEMESKVAAAEEPVAEAPKASVADEVHEEQSFAELYEQSTKTEGAGARKHYRVGERVTGKIFQLGAETAFITLGGKSEALIDLNELKDDEGILRFGVGDEVTGFVTEAGAKGIVLTRKLSKGAASVAMLIEAKDSGMPVDGLVLAVNKGGLEVAVGDARAFCPASQVDVRQVRMDGFVGERLTFRVTEVRGKKVVLSRRALLEEEQKVKAAETRKSLDVGKVVKGSIVSVRDFGAFVDLGGVEGLIPVSELAHTHVGHPSEVVKVGDEVEVEVIRMEPGNPNSPDKAKQKERITLSLRARQEDPWKAVLAELKEGDRLTGKVARLQPFGAFVELRPGVDGLIHISALSDRRIAHPKDVVKVGQEVQVEVQKVDPAEKRIGLRLVREGEEAVASPAERKAEPKHEGPRPKVGAVVVGKIDRIEPYGVFLAFPGGKGLVPASETGTQRGTDLRKHFQLGQELKVSILEIDGSGKIRLSVTEAERAEERAEMDAWKKSQPKGSGGKGFGTFADLLKGKVL